MPTQLRFLPVLASSCRVRRGLGGFSIDASSRGFRGGGVTFLPLYGPPVTAVTAINCGADLRVTKTNGAGSVVAGSTTSYTVTVSNMGPSAAAGTSLTDTPSAGLSCSTVTCTATGGAVCPAASMPFGSLTTGVLISPFPANSTTTFVVSCTVTATGS